MAEKPPAFKDFEPQDIEAYSEALKTYHQTLSAEITGRTAVLTVVDFFPIGVTPHFPTGKPIET